MNKIKKYWNRNFAEKGLIWGDKHNMFAEMVSQNVDSKDKLLLDLGCGYGRDSDYLYKRGFRVYGIDVSETAIAMAKIQYPEIQFKIGDMRKLDFGDNHFDIIFIYSVLHLFNKVDRKKILQEIYRVLKPNASAYCCVASINDADYGTGNKVAKNSYRNKRGVVKHFFEKDEITGMFKHFSNINISEEKIYHTHDFDHVHSNFNIIAQK